MEKGITFTRILAVVGTILTGFPILATVVTSIVGSVLRGVFLFDYLMPAELFFVALAGGLLLLWAALRIRVFRKPVIFGLTGMCVFLAASQVIALVSGLAQGDIEPAGFVWILVVSLIVLYTLAVIELMVVGIVMTKKLIT